MKVKIVLLIAAAAFSYFATTFVMNPLRHKAQSKAIVVQDTLKTADTIKKTPRYVLFKKNAHASYYADKFNGRRTASGKRFDNSKYTAAHRKLPFGTKLRVTNEANKKSVTVVVNDRGPFTRGRDIDLTKKAFMQIAPSRYGGSLEVTIEEVKE